MGLAAVLVAGCLLLIVAPIAAAAAPFSAPSTSWATAPGSWSNGLVLCDFASNQPMVGVSALSRADTGLSSDLTSVSEVTPSGDLLANATLSSNGWSASNLSTEDTYDLDYSLHATVTGPLAPFATLGAVDLRVDYLLPIYAGSPSGPTDTVSVVVLISNWSWQAANDYLELAISAWPTYSDGEHLTLGSPPGSLVSSTLVASGETLEEMAGSETAVVNPNSTNPGTVAATPSPSGNSTLGTVSVVLGSALGEYSSVSYAASVHVLFPRTIAGIPTVDLVAVGGIAGTLTLLIAAVAHRLRGRPSDLTFVEEAP